MYDYMLQSFKGHTDQILHRSSGIFPSNDFYDFIRRRFPEPEHDQRRKRLERIIRAVLPPTPETLIRWRNSSRSAFDAKP